MIKEHNILISSVGGQGGVALARVLSTAALSLGIKVRVGETLGMAQRGGPVESHVRFGEEVYGPLIPYGGTHVLLSLEPGESLRAAKYLGKRTKVIVNTSPSPPVPVLLKEARYPNMDEIVQRLVRIVAAIYQIDATEIARKVGAAESMNIAVLGAYQSLDKPILTLAAIREALSQTLPRRYLDANLKALRMGMDRMKELTQAQA